MIEKERGSVYIGNPLEWLTRQLETGEILVKVEKYLGEDNSREPREFYLKELSALIFKKALFGGGGLRYSCKNSGGLPYFRPLLSYEEGILHSLGFFPESFTFDLGIERVSEADEWGRRLHQQAEFSFAEIPIDSFFPRFTQVKAYLVKVRARSFYPSSVQRDGANEIVVSRLERYFLAVTYASDDASDEK